MLRSARVVAAFLLVSSLARAQDMAGAPRPPIDTTQTIRLFLDCQASGCDFDYLRTELTWVNYVRDRTVAQVHVIATQLSTGGGGSEITLKFIGLKEFAGVDDEVRFTTPMGASSDDLRRELTRVLKVGLARYVIRTPLGSNLTLDYVVPMLREGAPRPGLHDPWNFWVFSVGVNGSLNGESQSSSDDISDSFSASRTTADWKVRLGFNGDRSRNRYTLDDGSTLDANTHSYGSNGMLVRSVGPHVSLGATLAGQSSTQQNYDLQLRLAPTAEYDVFKYDQYTRRRLVLAYSVGFNRNRYTDTTLFDKLRETLVDHNLTLAYGATEPWGSVNLGLSGSNYLSDWTKYRVGITSGLSLRVAQGLQFSFNAGYNRIHDQIAPPKGGASDDERLLRLQQLQTSFSYNGYFGLSYTFGSVFNNVVNPRFGGSGDGGMMMCC